MKNGVFGEYLARFEGIWQTKCFKDEEVDKLWVEEKAKDGEEIPMRAVTMMKRNTNDNEEVYQWRWRGIPMMKRSIDDYDEELEKKEDGDDE